MNIINRLKNAKKSKTRKKVIIHFGYHKTGTSSMQEVMFSNRSLLKNYGVFYPKSLLGFPAPQELAWSLIEENKKDWMNLKYDSDFAYKSVIKDFENSGCHTLIVSSEDFTFLEKEKYGLSKIKNYFSTYDVELICYVREPIDFLLSLYGHRIRVGDTTKSFESYVNENMNLEIAAFHKRIAAWERVFGREKLKVCDFNHRPFYNNNITNDFFFNLGINIDYKFNEKKSNSSLHPWCSELVRNIYNDSQIENKDKIVKEILKFSKVLPKVKAEKYYISEDFLIYLNDYYKVSNDILNEKYGINYNE